MTRSTVACRVCKGPLGNLDKPSEVFHPGADVQLLYVDHERRTTTVRCPSCRRNVVIVVPRIDLGRHPP